MCAADALFALCGAAERCALPTLDLSTTHLTPELSRLASRHQWSNLLRLKIGAVKQVRLERIVRQVTRDPHVTTCRFSEHSSLSDGWHHKRSKGLRLPVNLACSASLILKSSNTKVRCAARLILMSSEDIGCNALFQQRLMPLSQPRIAS